jgi:hypothetical protein
VGRNLIHNALYAVQQRGTGPWNTVNVLTADRWQTNFATDTMSVSITALGDAARAQIGDEQAANALQVTFTGTAGGYTSMIQRMENVRRFSNKTIIVSFWAQTNAALQMAVQLQNYYGAGGAAQVNSPTVTVSIPANAWTRVFGVIANPSASGKTLGTAGTDFCQLTLLYSAAGSPAVQSGTINIWGVQCEIAASGQTQPTPLEKKEYADDLKLCQRFFQIVWVSDRGPASAANQQFATTVGWPTMRANPTAAVSVAGNNNLATGAALTISGTNGGRFGFASTGAGDCFVLDQAYSLTADL